ncbi:unnamed protein product [Ambrosiozyma monospora]|uniref:Unnamed protein product n=1 Tax=Ambrosiozyma monospora TaxID=43982 RepID=A0ACB5SXP5_AMBMO|nr:unnamed protein product [Ambrosiozyma monospora]
MPLEELLTHNSGVLGVSLVKGTVRKPESYVQMLVDDYSYPGLTSKMSEGKRVRPSSGSVCIRDLQNSILSFRVTKTDNVVSKKDVWAESKTDYKVIDLIKKGEPLMLDLDGNKLQFQFEYIPSSIALGQTELMEDTGILDLAIVSAKGLHANDRGGTSDPYATVVVDGKEVYKTQTIKKTIDPVWNENVTVAVPSRTRTEIQIKVYDWDQVGDNDQIGYLIFDATQLPVGKSVPMEFNLDPKGIVQLTAKFTPKYMKPILTNEGELDLVGAPLKLAGAGLSAGLAVGAGAANLAGGVAGAGVGAVTGVAGAGVGAVTSIGGGIKRGLKFGHKKSSSEVNKKASSDASSANPQINVVAPALGGNVDGNNASGSGSILNNDAASNNRMSVASSPMKNRRVSSDIQSFMSTSLTGNSVAGRVTVVGARGINSSDHIQTYVRLLSPNSVKDIYKTKTSKPSNGEVNWKESVSLKSPSDAKLLFVIKEHHRIGKDVELASAELLISEAIEKNGSDFEIPLSTGTGSLILNVRVQANAPPSPAL